MMRKLYGFLALFVLMASSVLATNLVLDPQVTSMAPSEVKVVEACISENAVPLVDIDLVVPVYCQDNNLSDHKCAGGDILFPADFSAVATKTPTNVSGCGEITLTTGPGASGRYRYRVNGEESGEVIALEHGLVLIPEFTTIGAGLALAGASFYMYRKRSKK